MWTYCSNDALSFIYVVSMRMSAFLDIPAASLNLLHEYGYNTRTFLKTPRVFQSAEYSSCLFLVYKQNEPIKNRIDRYRNHFTLFRNKDSVVIVRSETTLIHTDNDAILIYDKITPSSNMADCLRSKRNDWVVSFDKIQYSNSYPSLIGYTMDCSGEWWYFDRGIILNGTTYHGQTNMCFSTFVYYEMHVDHRIQLPSNYAVTKLPPVITVVQSSKPPSKTLDEMDREAANTNTNIPQQATTSSLQQPTLEPSTLQALTVTTTAETEQTRVSESREQTPTPPPPPQQPPAARPNDFIQIIRNSLNGQAAVPNSTLNAPVLNNNTTTRLSLPPRSLVSSSLPSSILPFLNSVARPTIRANDNIKVPELRTSSVLPSLFWFQKRSEELKTGNIEYFVPVNSSCGAVGVEWPNKNNASPFSMFSRLM